MRRIRLETALEFGSRADFNIIDVTELGVAGLDETKLGTSPLMDEPSAANKAKKRGTITIDYAPSDIAQLKSHGMDFDAALEYYRTRIYELVKFYISGDWEPAGGMDEALDVIKRHIEGQF